MRPRIRPLDCNPEAKFIFPDRGDKVNSGIGLSYRPARLHRLASRYDNLMPESTIFPKSENLNLATAWGLEAPFLYRLIDVPADI
jgi:hypothetical protein